MPDVNLSLPLIQLIWSVYNCWRRLLIAGLLVCLFLAASAAHAADITLSDTCSLANAIRSANGDAQVAPANQCAAGDASGSDVIIFVADVVITEALPTITSDIIIDGGNVNTLRTPKDAPSEDPATYDFGLLSVTKGTLDIRSLHLAGAGDSAIKAVKAAGSDLKLIFADGGISHSNAKGSGGAIYIEGGADVEIYRILFSLNTAANGSGGAIYAKNSNLHVKWSYFRSNSATGNGGAIYFENDSSDEYKLSVIGNSFKSDKADDDDDSTSTAENGGAIYYSNAVTSDGATSKLADNSFTAHSARNGGAIYQAGGTLIADNNTLDENTATDKGGALYVASGTLTVRHATIVKNKAAVGGGLAIFTNDGDSSQNPEVNIYNSIIADNTNTDTTDTTCFKDALNSNEGNIIQDSNCPAAQAVEADLLLAPVDASPGDLPRSLASRYYRLMPGSPAIDRADEGEGRMLPLDQLGRIRPQGAGYDIGSYEFGLLPPDPDGRRSGGAAADDSGISKEIIHTCGPLSQADNGISIEATYGLESGVQCQEIDAIGIGIQWIIDAGFIKAVDIWSYVEQGVQVCFDASGPLLFLDAATIPKVVMPISSFTLDGKTCAYISRPGSIVLQSSGSTASSLPVATLQATAVPASTPPPPTNCTVTTTAVLNFRDAPNGNRMGWIPQNVTLTVLESANGWLKVNYARDGWISADYVTPRGDC